MYVILFYFLVHFFSGSHVCINLYLFVFQSLYLAWTNFLMKPSSLVLVTLLGRLLGEIVCVRNH